MLTNMGVMIFSMLMALGCKASRSSESRIADDTTYTPVPEVVDDYRTQKQSIDEFSREGWQGFVKDMTSPRLDGQSLPPQYLDWNHVSDFESATEAIYQKYIFADIDNFDRSKFRKLNTDIRTDVQALSPQQRNALFARASMESLYFQKRSSQFSKGEGNNFGNQKWYDDQPEVIVRNIDAARKFHQDNLERREQLLNHAFNVSLYQYGDKQK